jgi:SAM-dependent methyltransferase
MPPPADAYDAHPYTDHAYAESHPDRLAVVARLAGWQPPALDGARVLELGCGRGGNLLPMAASAPGASFAGVDLSERQIDEARRIARETGARNVRFERGDAAAFAPAAEHAFVIAHGLCSWVAPDVRRALLRAITSALAPGGVAYVSFNVLPGWYDRLAARDWLRTFARAGEDPRASLEWLRGAISPELADYRRRLEAVAARIGETDPAYAAHEYLAPEHHPQAVGEWLAEARDAGLRYLGDAIPGETALELLSPEAAARAAGLDDGAREALVDFVRNTAFRRALVVREADARARGWTRPARLDAGALSTMRLTTRLAPRGAHEDPGARSERFEAPDGTSLFEADPAARRALHRLAAAAPASLAFAELAEGAGDGGRALGAWLLDLWLGTGAVGLHATQPPLGDAAAERPLASPVARWHARHGGAITNLWHEEVILQDPALREVLTLLDGTRTVADVAHALGADGTAAATLDEASRASLARAAVAALGASALLVRP